MGLDSFDLDRFFGSPFAFGRIIDETFDQAPDGVLDKDAWEEIRAKNARYRNRALDYVNGARAGNTPFGMRLTAKAGLGHDVEIIENYKYLFDVRSDDPLGLDKHGQTDSTGEFVVVPRRTISQSETQSISIIGEPFLPNAGSFRLVYNGSPSDGTYSYFDGTSTLSFTDIPWNATRDHVRLALERIDAVGEGNVKVEGGPLPNFPVFITFQNELADWDVPQLESVNNLAYNDINGNPLSNNVVIFIETLVGGQDASDEVVSIAPKDQYTLQQALDRIRPQTTIPTLYTGKGTKKVTTWNQVDSTSEYTEVVRFVTGSPTIDWPVPSPSKPYNWIEAKKEKEAPRIQNDLQYHYSAFHNISKVTASSVAATADDISVADKALANYAEPLFITASKEINGTGVSMINGIYPTDYAQLPGAPQIQYSSDNFWASAERSDDEWLTIHFPFVKCVNYISFDILKVPVQIDIEYDILDSGETEEWHPAQPVGPFSNILYPSMDESNVWASLGLSFVDLKSQLPWSRALRIGFTRLRSYDDQIKVKNLRAGRNIG
jgi:hypothetical protein